MILLCALWMQSVNCKPIQGLRDLLLHYVYPLAHYPGWNIPECNGQKGPGPTLIIDSHLCFWNIPLIISRVVLHLSRYL